MAVRILAVFDIGKAQNEKGEVVEPEAKFTHDGVARHVIEICHCLFPLTVSSSRYPLPFECTIKPRSREAVELLREE